VRAIKFRVWHRDAKEMFHPEQSSHALRWLEEGQPVEIMQFIEMQDMDGKEIYEGDIVQWNSSVRTDAMNERYGDDWPENPDLWLWDIERDVVTLDHFRYWLKKESFGYEGEDLIWPGSCVVIGNIHENPELLDNAQPQQQAR
jgi:uncharacterized phage protein (TIGR01671 family)